MVSAMGHVFPFSIPTHRVLRELPSSPDPRPPIFFEILCGLLLSSSANKHDRMVSAISLDRTKMEIDGRMISLSPGMAVTVEIKTGSRTILSYLHSACTDANQDGSFPRAQGGR
jgi:hypothetical protein